MKLLLFDRYQPSFVEKSEDCGGILLEVLIDLDHQGPEAFITQDVAAAAQDIDLETVHVDFHERGTGDAGNADEIIERDPEADEGGEWLERLGLIVNRAREGVESATGFETMVVEEIKARALTHRNRERNDAALAAVQENVSA
jgi:hypothetical protein